MSTKINRDEWLSALKDAGLHDEGDPDSISVVEFAAMMHLKRATAQRCLYGLVEQGKAVKAKKRITDSQHRVVTVTSYRLLTGRKK